MLAFCQCYDLFEYTHRLNNVSPTALLFLTLVEQGAVFPDVASVSEFAAWPIAHHTNFIDFEFLLHLLIDGLFTKSSHKITEWLKTGTETPFKTTCDRWEEIVSIVFTNVAGFRALRTCQS